MSPAVTITYEAPANGGDVIMKINGAKVGNKQHRAAIYLTFAAARAADKVVRDAQAQFKQAIDAWRAAGSP